MKHITLLLITICLLFSSAFAQSKIEFGVTTEGSWFFPESNPQNLNAVRNGLCGGFGIYAMRNISGKLSADVGLVYRMKQMKEYNDVYFNTSGGYGNSGPYGIYDAYSPHGTGFNIDSGSLYGYGYNFSESGKIKGWKRYPFSYVIIPLHLQYLVYKKMFVSGGIEVGWVTNTISVNDNPEFNWTIGLGSQLFKYKLTANYIRGFNELSYQSNLWTRSDGLKSSTIYRNNMIQLSLSYPIWVKK